MSIICKGAKKMSELNEMNVSETETMEKKKAKVRHLYTKWFTGIEDMKCAENGRINIENEITPADKGS